MADVHLTPVKGNVKSSRRVHELTNNAREALHNLLTCKRFIQFIDTLQL